MKRKTNKIDWQYQASVEAADAHKHNFSSRRGIYSIADDKGEHVAFCIYNNNPWAGDPLPDTPTSRRARELAAFRAWMSKQDGMSELAFASYPADTGYTTALMIAAPEDAVDEIKEQYMLAVQRHGLEAA